MALGRRRPNRQRPEVGASKAVPGLFLYRKKKYMFPEWIRLLVFQAYAMLSVVSKERSVWFCYFRRLYCFFKITIHF